MRGPSTRFIVVKQFELQIPTNALFKGVTWHKGLGGTLHNISHTFMMNNFCIVRVYDRGSSLPRLCTELTPRILVLQLGMYFFIPWQRRLRYKTNLFSFTKLHPLLHVIFTCHSACWDGQKILVGFSFASPQIHPNNNIWSIGLISNSLQDHD